MTQPEALSSSQSVPLASEADAQREAASVISAGRTVLGIEFGSTRIKACLIHADVPSRVLAVGSHEWENTLIDQRWTYSLDAVWSGVRDAYSRLVADIRQRYDVTLTSLGAIGISAMMHGYLAFDTAGDLLVPFRTWRNTSTGPAARELTELFGVNIPLRWSIAHLHQAVRDGEEHIARIASLNTLAGYVHRALTGENVLGIGDASGMFPIDPHTHDYDRSLIDRYDKHAGSRLPGGHLRSLLPDVLPAGASGGSLTAQGASLLDPSGALQPGAIACPPEGDAGTGMVATRSIAPRTGNVSAGTSIFAMVVLEKSLAKVHDELDLVTTPAGDPVAMIHCNNGASELAAWVELFAEFARSTNSDLSVDATYDVLFRAALSGALDTGGVLSYNQLSGEPIAALGEGRPLVVRMPGSQLRLGTFMRSQIYGVFATLALGMRVLRDENVALDTLYAHGGMFRTAGVAQRFLAGALNVPVSLAETASEGGAWGIAVLAAFSRTQADGLSTSLSDYLDNTVFPPFTFITVEPDPADAAGFSHYLVSYSAGLAIERAAVSALPTEGAPREQ